MPTAISRWAAEEAYSSLEFVTWPGHSSLHKKQKSSLRCSPSVQGRVRNRDSRRAAPAIFCWDVFLTLLLVLWSWSHAVL